MLKLIVWAIIFIASQIVARSTSEQILFTFLLSFVLMMITFSELEKEEIKQEQRKKILYNFNR